MSSISSIRAVYANDHSEAYRRVQNWKALGNALEAGDLSAAQTAFDALQAGKPKHIQESLKVENNTIKADMQALSEALQSSNLEAAKESFAKLQEDLKNLRAELLEKRHRHHHHHRGESTDDFSTTTTDGTSILSTGEEQSIPGSNFNAVA